MLTWCDYAREILCDYLRTKKENKELKEELEMNRKFNYELFKGSQKIQGAWISALLNNDIQVTPKENKKK